MLLNILTERFKNHTFYAIGGYVRNKIYKNNKSEDIDILTNATEDEVGNIIGRDFYHIKINDVIRVKDIDRNSHIDIYCYTDLDKDLSERDFKINKVLYDLHNDKFISDSKLNLYILEYIKESYYKHVPLSIFRAIRISLQNKILLSKEIEDIICKIDISKLNKNNLRKEIFSIILEDNGLETLKKYGLLEKIIPEFKDTYDFDQNSIWHDLNLYNHITKSIEESPREIEIRLAMLFHDLGKIQSKTINSDGHFSYKGHEDISVSIAIKWLKEYETPQDMILNILSIIQNHMNRNMRIDNCIKKIGKKNTQLLLEVNEADIKARLNTKNEELSEIYVKKNEILNYNTESEKPIDKNKPTLYLIIGLPRSGKSTYYKNFLSHCEYISRDEIRENVFGYKGNMNHEEEVSKIFTERYQDALNKNKDICIDNTNIQLKYRVKFVNSCKSRKYNVIAIYVDAKYDDVLNNAKNDNFPIEVIESMFCRLNKPTYEEGYNKIIKVTPEFKKNNIEYKEEKYNVE